MSHPLSLPRWLLVACAIVLVQNVSLIHAFWTVDCGIVASERTDPIRFFNTESTHVHVIAGSSAIGQNSTNADLRGGGTRLQAPSCQASAVLVEQCWRAV